MSEQLRQFYERRSAEYPEVDTTAEVRYEKALALAELAPSARVLDIGCKDGRLLEIIRGTHPAIDYVGIDISTNNIERCRERHTGATFVAGTLDELTPQRGFDAIFALEVLEHVPNPAGFLDQIRALLAPGGALILSVPNPYYYMEFVNELRGFPDTEGHLYSFTDANLRALLEVSGFDAGAGVGTYFLVPKRLRGAFRTQAYWILRHIPARLACSRIYRCTPRTAG